jgi:hypothetical protein
MARSAAAKMRALQEELDDAYTRIDDLEEHIRTGAELLDAEDLEEVLEGAEEFADEDDVEEADVRRNGIFTDALRYGARRVDERKARKKSEKAAIAQIRATEARKRR